MGKEKFIEVEGVVTEATGNGFFRVERMLNGDGTGHILEAHLSGKMRQRYIKVLPGDKVKMEMSPYDMTKARITYRLK